MRAFLGMIAAACLVVSGALAEPARAAPLTDDALKAMLEGLGYSTEESTGNGTKNYTIKDTLPDNTLTFSITLQLSPDKTLLWIFAVLYGIPEGKTPPNEVLLGLLKTNDDIAPEFFSYSASNKAFFLNDPTAAGEVTPAMLRQRLKTLISTLASTRPLWDPQKWSGQ